MEHNNKSDTSNNKGQIEPSQNRSENNQKSTTEQPYWALHTYTVGSADVLYSACSMQCNHSTAATLCTLETWIVAGT
jgi:hypothetical protein